MSRNFGAGPDYLQHSGAVVSGYPFSVSVWYRSDSLGLNQSLWAVSTNGSNNHYFNLYLAGLDPGDFVTFAAVDASERLATTSIAYSSLTWQHAAAVATSATDRAVYLNGGSKGTNTTSCTPAGMNRTTIGALTIPSVVRGMNGRIAEVAVWNAALNDAEVAALAQGADPRRIRGGSLISYPPIWGLHSPEIDLRPSGATWTLTGTANRDNHAPVRPFSRLVLGTAPLIEEAAAMAKGHYYRHLQRSAAS